MTRAQPKRPCCNVTNLTEIRLRVPVIGHGPILGRAKPKKPRCVCGTDETVLERDRSLRDKYAVSGCERLLRKNSGPRNIAKLSRRQFDEILDGSIAGIHLRESVDSQDYIALPIIRQTIDRARSLSGLTVEHAEKPGSREICVSGRRTRSDGPLKCEPDTGGFWARYSSATRMASALVSFGGVTRSQSKCRPQI